MAQKMKDQQLAMGSMDSQDSEPVRGSIFHHLKDSSPVKQHMQQRFSVKFKMSPAGDGTSDSMYASKISNNRFGAKK